MKSKIYNKKKEYVFQELPIQYFIQVFEQQFLTKRKILILLPFFGIFGQFLAKNCSKTPKKGKDFNIHEEELGYVQFIF